MEISLSDLKDLLNNNSSSDSDPKELRPELLGKRVLSRTHSSGVSIGILDSMTAHSGIVQTRLRDSWRIWYFPDSFTCSELAMRGGEGNRVDKNSEAFTTFEQAVEIQEVTDEAWDLIRSTWVVGRKS